MLDIIKEDVDFQDYADQLQAASISLSSSCEIRAFKIGFTTGQEQSQCCTMNSMQDEIINGLAKLNDAGKDMVLASVNGALMNANFCTTGKISFILSCKQNNNRKRKDVFMRLDKSEPDNTLASAGRFKERGVNLSPDNEQVLRWEHKDMNNII